MLQDSPFKIGGQPVLGQPPLQIGYRLLTDAPWDVQVTAEPASNLPPPAPQPSLPTPIYLTITITAPPTVPAPPIDLTPVIDAILAVAVELAELRDDLTSRTWSARWRRFWARFAR